MNTSTNSTFLKEMGITQWTLRDEISTTITEELANPIAENKKSFGIWWFFGNKPQGDAQVLFQNIIRALGLSADEWSWKNPADKINLLDIPGDGRPLVAIAFGAAVAQKLSGERDTLPELRQTVLAINAQGIDELPLIATFELNQLLSKPKDKSLLWQDLLLAKSVLQNC